MGHFQNFRINSCYNRYFAIIIEEGDDLKNLEQNVDIEINYLKKIFGQRAVRSA